MTDNVIDIRKLTEPDRMRKFIFETEDDFRAIKLLAAAIQRMTIGKDEDAPIFQIAREIVGHLQAIEERLQGGNAGDE